MGRFGKHKEQRYRQQFEKQFDFLTFNKELTLSQGSGRYAIAFDPSYINKAGKHTPGVGYFWSGCANRAKWGLEIGGLAAIDIDNHTAFHLEAIQTVVDKERSLSDWYANVISDRQSQLLGISPYLIADAWFAKRSFVDHLEKADILNDQVETYALITGNLALEAKMSASMSDLVKLNNNQFVMKVQEVVVESETHLDPLLNDYGVNEGQLEDLKNDLDSFCALQGMPRAYQISSAVATKNLDELFKQAHDTLQKLDKAMKLFKRRDANFYNGYLAARVVVDN